MRLIDADELINQGYEMVVDGLQYDTCNKSIDIDDIPTAYSVDKVVAELEKESFTTTDTVCGGIFKAIRLSSVIEIVKQRGVSNDVCEWKYTKEIMDNAEFKVGCNQNALKRGIVPNNFSYHDFKYCPYCGKKIKVVE